MNKQSLYEQKIKTDKGILNQIVVEVELGLTPEEEQNYLGKYRDIKALIDYNSQIDLLVLTRIIVEFREQITK